MTANSQKVYVKNYGCQMNVYDGQKMADLLKPHGYAITETPEDADVAILNTCHIREKATEKVYSELGRINKEKIKMAKNGRDMVIIMSGCVAQAEGELVFARAKYVDIVVGIQVDLISAEGAANNFCVVDGVTTFGAFATESPALFTFAIGLHFIGGFT